MRRASAVPAAWPQPHRHASTHTAGHVCLPQGDPREAAGWNLYTPVWPCSNAGSSFTRLSSRRADTGLAGTALPRQSNRRSGMKCHHATTLVTQLRKSAWLPWPHIPLCSVPGMKAAASDPLTLRIAEHQHTGTCLAPRAGTSLQSCSCVLCVQPAPLLIQSKTLLQKPAAAQGKCLSSSPTQQQSLIPYHQHRPRTCRSLSPGIVLLGSVGKQDARLQWV